jgi:hypothetical protein
MMMDAQQSREAGMDADSQMVSTLAFADWLRMSLVSEIKG